MNHRIHVTGILCFMLAGCASHQGQYAPDCVAFAGDTVSLEGDNFVWQRFTDQVKVDANGDVIDPFPEYPKRGSYTLDGATVRLTAESGETMENLYLRRIDGSYRLMTAEQNGSWRETGRYDQCVLTRGSGDKS